MAQKWRERWGVDPEHLKGGESQLVAFDYDGSLFEGDTDLTLLWHLCSPWMVADIVWGFFVAQQDRPSILNQCVTHVSGYHGRPREDWIECARQNLKIDPAIVRAIQAGEGTKNEKGEKLNDFRILSDGQAFAIYDSLYWAGLLDTFKHIASHKTRYVNGEWRGIGYFNDYDKNKHECPACYAWMCKGTVLQRWMRGEERQEDTTDFLASELDQVGGLTKYKDVPWVGERKEYRTYEGRQVRKRFKECLARRDWSLRPPPVQGRKANQRAIFVCDGSNDVCGLLALQPKDIAIVRKGKALDGFLRKNGLRGFVNEGVTIEFYSTRSQMAELLTEYTTNAPHPKVPKKEPQSWWGWITSAIWPIPSGQKGEEKKQL